MKDTDKKGHEQGYVYLPYKLEFTVPKIVEGTFSPKNVEVNGMFHETKGTFSPKILLRSRYSNVEVNGMFHETKGTFSPKILLRSRYSNVEVNGMFHETIGEKKSKGKQIFSELDPYGEENWDD